MIDSMDWILLLFYGACEDAENVVFALKNLLESEDPERSIPPDALEVYLDILSALLYCI